MKALWPINQLLRRARGRSGRAALIGCALALTVSGLALAAGPSGPLTTGAELFSGKGSVVRSAIYGVYGTYRAHIVKATTPHGALHNGDTVPTSANSATFGFKSFEIHSKLTNPLAVFTCRLDQGSQGLCVSGKTYSNLATGHHRFQVWDVTTQGAKATLNWTIKKSGKSGGGGKGGHHGHGHKHGHHHKKHGHHKKHHKHHRKHHHKKHHKHHKKHH